MTIENLKFTGTNTDYREKINSQYVSGCSLTSPFLPLNENHLLSMLSTDPTMFLDGSMESVFDLYFKYLSFGSAANSGYDSYKNYFGKSFKTETNLPSLKSKYNPAMANRLANIAERNALNTNSTGMCARGVRQSLERSGLSKGEIIAGSAYKLANILDSHKNFEEVKVERSDLKNLPAGCVVVWDKSAGHEHGHIAVTLGNGKEASDHVQNLVTGRNAQFRVFVPSNENSLCVVS